MSGETLLRRGKLPDYSLTVASSLSLILPKIKETNETTLEVLHLLSYLGPDAITKLLLRNLLSAKKKFDDECAEEERRKAASKNRRLGHSTVAGGLILGGVTLVFSSTLMLPATRSQRTCVVIALSVASSFFILSRVSAFVPESILADQTTSCAPNSFSAFEYDQSDDAWDILKSFSLVSVKDGKGSVHRLLQQAMRSCHSKEETLYYIAVCVDAILSCWTFKPNSTESWKSSLQLLEHVKVIVAHCKEYDVDANRLLKIAQLSKEAGVLSAMALNAFVEAQLSLELSLEFLERSSAAKKLDARKAKAESQYELSKIHRYQGRYDDANKCLVASLELNNTDDCLTADTLHELGILEVKKHNLDTATAYLQQSLEIRRGLNDANDQANASSTLHQLAAIHIARKPPSLEMATSLLLEALGLSRQIGQRAATIKQLARVTVRQGFLDQAESYLEQALELYLELYGSKMHINIAAVKFQMGALALQRNMLDNAWLCFHECLRIRRHVYAYACPEGSSTENTYPIHFEVSCVLHELGCVGLAQKRFTQSMNMLEAERVILERLAESSTQNERIYQARLTNLTWLRKCAKEMGDESRATFFSTERFNLKHHEGHQFIEESHHELSKTAALQGKALQCRQLARKFALEKSDSNSTCRDELVSCLNELQEETRRVETGPMTEATLKFHETLFLWLNKSGRRSPILSACDSLRCVFILSDFAPSLFNTCVHLSSTQGCFASSWNTGQ
jgi:tetratricopeptide (TPR) repeat protein